MLGFILFFLILAIVAASMGSFGVAFISVEMAKILFFIFIALFLFSLIVHMLGYTRVKPPVD